MRAPNVGGSSTLARSIVVSDDFEPVA